MSNLASLILCIGILYMIILIITSYFTFEQCIINQMTNKSVLKPVIVFITIHFIILITLYNFINNILC